MGSSYLSYVYLDLYLSVAVYCLILIMYFTDGLFACFIGCGGLIIGLLYSYFGLSV